MPVRNVKTKPRGHKKACGCPFCKAYRGSK